MNPNKILFIPLIVIGLWYFYSDRPNSKKKINKNRTQKIFTGETKKALVKEFAQALENSPQVMARVAPQQVPTKRAAMSSDQALDNLLDAQLKLDPNQQLEFKKILKEDLDRSLPNMFHRYDGLSADNQQIEKNKLLSLVHDLCGRAERADCTDFVLREAFNERLGTSEQLNSLKSYLSTKYLDINQKIDAVARFKANHSQPPQDPKLMQELKTIEAFVLKNQNR